MRTPLILGNWKMHKTIAETCAFVDELLPLVDGVDNVEAGIAPPFTALYPASKIIDESNLMLGAQNCHWADSGAFTGELSVEMLEDVGCSFAIIGHSERRQFFGETDDGVNRRTIAALDGDLTPVVCVGETLEERDQGREFEIVEAQLRRGLDSIKPESLERVVLAYEPVWAIGTGRTATNDQAQQMHAFIRKILEDISGVEVATKIRILYGGSVNPENAASILGEPDVDGALVGGASLVAQKFASIIRFRV